MSMTPEKKVKIAVMKQLKEMGAYAFYPATGGYGFSGVPDIVGCLNGKFFAIECKAGKNSTSPLQEKNLDAIRNAGGTALIVNEENMFKVKDLLARPTYIRFS